MLGSDPRDTYNGTIYDQIGSLNGTPTNFDAAADIELDSPVMKDPYYGAGPANKNMYWHRYLEERSGSAMPSGDAARQSLLGSIRNTFDRRVNSPVKLAVEGYTAIGGVGRHANFDPNYVFGVARGAGPISRATYAGQYLLTLTGSIEKLLGTTDEYYPTFKQRLGFGMSVWSGKDAIAKDDGRNGSQYAPFRLYSSSVTDRKSVV